jgi:diguanylate cyclase (GGDEF)-like protein
MPTTDALLVVILIAMLINLAFASLLLVPRWRELALGGARMPALAGHGGAMNASDGRVRPIGLFGPLAPTPVPTDPETGFDLPGTWARWLEDEDARVRRYRRWATVVLIEIEGLDMLVERLGPEAVSRVVSPVAVSLRGHARETDRLARLGVGRFGVLLTETDEIQAINYVERIRAACDAWLEAGGVPSRLLIGWAEISNRRSIDAAIEAAEERLSADRGQDQASPPTIEGGDDDLQGFRASA